MARIPIPKYRRQKRSKGADTAFVELNGRRHYLGQYSSAEARERYTQLIAEWEANGRQPPVRLEDITIAELVARFWTWAQAYYVSPNGDTTNEVNLFKLALRPLTALYGRSKASEFGPMRLKTVRQRMIDLGWSRIHINKQIGRLKRMFKWAAENELVPATVFHGLQTVAGLKRGRCDAHDPDPVQPVPNAAVDATLPHMTPTLAAMVTVQRYTGMRPCEVVLIRGCDLETVGPVWLYRPETHKTQHHGRSRTVYLGPKAQAAVLPLLRQNLHEYLFQPIQSEDERRERMHEARETPLTCGNQPGTNRKRHPKRGPTDRYSTGTYGKAVEYACRRAFPAPDGVKGDELKAWRREHHWCPSRLRHTFATEVRREYGLEASQILLGHSHADVTQVYAQRDVGRAVDVIGKVG